MGFQPMNECFADTYVNALRQPTLLNLIGGPDGERSRHKCIASALRRQRNMRAQIFARRSHPSGLCDDTPWTRTKEQAYTMCIIWLASRVTIPKSLRYQHSVLPLNYTPILVGY